MPDRPVLPPELAAASARRWREQLAEAGALPQGDAATLDYVLACSDFIGQTLLGDAEFRHAPDAEVADPFAGARGITDEAEFMTQLRRGRRRSLARIAWRDLTGLADTAQTLAALAALADEAIRAACDFATELLGARYGRPLGSRGEVQPLVVVGMGKLGGSELNFSSDVDLVFLYPEGGETDGRRCVDNFEYFTRLGQKLIQLLDATTPDGFVFRVDMRLRPFGDSGPLVTSFAALEDYLQQHGRDWERYAWVKARAITGVEDYARLFESTVRPFVYRRYLDFGVFESLREMKGMIAREVERRELDDNVKLGRGGIREIEFVVQALQLLRGGSDMRLRQPSLLRVLPCLAGQKLLADDAVRELAECYDFLRRLENRLQMYRDEQAHRLPEEPERRDRLVTAMRFSDWAALGAQIESVRATVARHFNALVFAAEVGVTPAATDFATALGGGAGVAELTPRLMSLGFGAAGELASILVALRDSGYYRRLDEPGRRRLLALLPRIVLALVGGEQAPVILRRALSVIEAIGPRTSYLALLNENPLARSRLLEICALGAFLPAQVAAFPLLLDELIDQRLFDEPPARERFAEELALRSDDTDGDLERTIEVLREFQRAAVFRVALFDLMGRLPLMQVSDRLTDIAELILERAMHHAWHEMVATYGEPMAGMAGARRCCAVAAVGYGKLGGRELGYVSDLDLVFLHDSDGDTQETSGPKVIDNAVFFLRLGQRIVHLLTVHTAAGRLYEVDMRLRPSGKGGMLITQIDAFVDYQKTEAWTWEHQALLHSRAVAGAPSLREKFEAARVELLQHAVRRDSLREDVRSMRDRMRRELSRAGAGEFDIKQDPGGLADIEFLAQYWVLRWACDHPQLAIFADTIRQLESVGSAALVDHALIDTLTAAYIRYRHLVHHLSLEGGRPVVAEAPHAQTRTAVVEIWDAVMVRGEDSGGSGATDAPPV